MRSKFLALLLCIPIAATATTKIVPLPKSGLVIVSTDNMDIPDSMKKAIKLKMEQEKKIGYIESDDTEARDLLLLPRKAKLEIAEFKNSSNPYDSHLKGKLSDIKLAFSFKELSPIKIEDILGYTPAGGYIKDKGWTGVGLFFNNPPREVCSYTFFNLIVSHGAVQLNKENTKYIINKKPSSTFIKGSHNSGFIYSVEWFDKTGMHKLECANMLFDKEIMKKTIALARKIDAR